MIWNRFEFLQSSVLSCSSSFWWNYDECLSICILKKSSHFMSLIKCRTFARLPRQQLHWRVLMTTGIGQLWQNRKNGSAICMSNALDLFAGWFNTMTPLFSEEITFDVFDSMICSTLHDWVMKNKHLSTSQCHSCSSFYHLLQNPQKPKEFHNNCISLQFQGVL